MTGSDKNNLDCKGIELLRTGNTLCLVGSQKGILNLHLTWFTTWGGGVDPKASEDDLVSTF